MAIDVNFCHECGAKLQVRLPADLSSAPEFVCSLDPNGHKPLVKVLREFADDVLKQYIETHKGVGRKGKRYTAKSWVNRDGQVVLIEVSGIFEGRNPHTRGNDWTGMMVESASMRAPKLSWEALAQGERERAEQALFDARLNEEDNVQQFKLTKGGE